MELRYLNDFVEKHMVDELNVKVLEQNVMKAIMNEFCLLREYETVQSNSN